MNYALVWKTLEELMVALKGKGAAVPQGIIDDLRSARTLIRIYQSEPADVNIVTDINSLLGKTESSLLFLAESAISKEYADEWQTKLIGLYTGESAEAVSRSGFVTGIPRPEYWIKLQTSDLITEKDLGELVSRFHLSVKPQKDTYLLVHGRKEDITLFLKEVRQRIAKTRS